MTNAVQVYEPEEHNALVQRNEALLQLRDNMFVKGVHYGEPYKDAGKPTLLKPGAETIMSRFQLWPKFVERSMVEQWTGSQPMFHYRYECQLIHRETGEIWGAGIGSCNSLEDKYGWRWVSENEVSPTQDKHQLETRGGTVSEFTFAIEKGETSGKYGKPESYWQMFKDAIAAGDARKIQKETRDKRKFDAWEIDATEYRIPNTNVFTIVNTIDKMAQKRAFVAAVLVATGASAYFTQDVEDFPGYAGEIIDGDYTVQVSEPEPAPEPPVDTVQPVQATRNGNGAVDSTEKGNTPEIAAQSATEPQNGNRAYKLMLWNEAKKFDIAESLMKKAVIELPEGVNWGWKTYEYAKETLGYRDDEHVKDTLGVASLKDWPLTCGEMLMKLVEDAPIPMGEAQTEAWHALTGEHEG